MCGILTGNSQVKPRADGVDKGVELINTGNYVVLASKEVGSDIGDALVLLGCKILCDRLVFNYNSLSQGDLLWLNCLSSQGILQNCSGRCGS